MFHLVLVVPSPICPRFDH